MPKSNLDDLLLQAAGRTGKNQSRPSNPRWNSGGSGSDGFDDDDDSDAAPTYSRKKPSSQVPLKKRHQPEKGVRRGGGGGWKDEDDEDEDERQSGGEDSDSAPSVGSDLYKDEDDKERLESMSELQREMILADRGNRIGDYKIKQRARASSSKTDKVGARKDSSPPPPPSRMRSSTRTDKSGSAAKSALDELRAKRNMRQQDSEVRNRFNVLLPNSGSPTRRRAGSPPSDGSNDGDNRGRPNDHGRIADDGRDDEFDESPSRLDPLKFDDVKSITLRRSKLVKWFMEPFFDDLISGCFVRLGIGKTKSGNPRYRLCIVRNVDASDPDRMYTLESYSTCKYLNVVWGSEADAARWQMTQVSDSPPNEEEFKEWLQEAEKNGARIPTRQEVLDKKEDIREKTYNFVYSADTVQRMLKEKSAVRRHINVAAEKDRLRSELEMALSRRNEAEAERIRAKLKNLENRPQPVPNDTNSKAAKLEAMNRKNRADNFKNASEIKPVNTSLKAGEAGYDPFSRRWTRSRNYYASKPGGDNAEEETANGSSSNVVPSNEDTMSKAQTGTAATTAAQVAAADAGKLIDTNAPVDLGTESNVLHTFELPISLSALQEFGGAKGLFDGYMARRQKIEATMGYKVPDNDGRRHALTLSVSDYKRRRGLL